MILLYKKPIINILSLAGMRVVGALLALALFVTLARTWGSHQLGEFSLLLNFFIFFQAIPILGLSILIQRDLSQHPELTNSYRTALHVITIGAALLIAIGLIITAHILYPARLFLPFCIISGAILLGAPALADESVLMAQEKMWIVAAISTGETILRTATALIGVAYGHELVWIACCYAISRLCASIVYHFILRRSRAPLDLRVTGALLRECPTFLVIVFASAALLRLDTLSLSFTHDLSAVGEYSTAFRLFELFLSMIVISVTALFPTIASGFTLSEKTRNHYIQAFKYVLLGGFPLVLSLVSASPLIIKAAYGGKFPGSAQLFSILMIMLFFYTIDRIFSTLVHAAKRPDLDRNALLIGAGILLCALFILVPRFGASGAAISTASAQFSILVVRILSVRRCFAWRGFLTNSKKALLASAMMCIVWIAVKWLSPGLPALPLALSAYAMILFITREVPFRKLNSALN